MPFSKLMDSELESRFRKAEARGICVSPHVSLEQNAIKRRYCSGLLVKPFNNQYARLDYWTTLPARDKARHIIRTLSQTYPQRVFSHSSAALLHYLEVPQEIIWPLHYFLGREKHGSELHGVKCHRSAQISCINKNGANITPIEQTVIDCAAEFPFELALPIADSALHQGLTDKAHLERYLENRINRRGVRRAQRVVETADERPDNGGESRVRALMIELGLPLPELQVPVPNPEKPGHYYYVDYMFTQQDGTKIAMELDGMDKYIDTSMTNGRSAVQVMMAERQREAAITSHGIKIVRFSYAQAMNPTVLLKRLRQYEIFPL